MSYTERQGQGKALSSSSFEGLMYCGLLCRLDIPNEHTTSHEIKAEKSEGGVLIVYIITAFIACTAHVYDMARRRVF
jgi:hypothetical protein